MNSDLIKISVVVPSYNQVAYLEQCLTSLVMQNCPNLEIVVMDGGSTDGSVAIIKQYEKHLHYWQSQPDGGQTQAITDGFQHTSGDYLTWLNSDDILLPESIKFHHRTILNSPEADVFYGNHVVIDSNDAVVERYRHPTYFRRLAWLTSPYIAQPGTVFTRRIWEQVGGADVEMHCAFDYDLWYRFMLAEAQFVHVGGFVSGFRRHPETKGATWLQKYAEEHAIIRQRYQYKMGNVFTRRLARYLLVLMQFFSGAYIETLSFRIFKQGRISAYQPKG